MGRALVTIAVALLLAAPAYAGVPLPQPNWAELTPQQKQALVPLAGEWDTMGGARRRKWLGIAERYPKMKPEEQQRVQQRMRDWTKLTPEQRRIAREKFIALKKATPEKRENVKQKWQEYDRLPNDEKQKLGQQIVKKPPPKTAPKPRPLPAKAKPVLPPPPGPKVSPTP